jgi:hypothetical protein
MTSPTFSRDRFAALTASETYGSWPAQQQSRLHTHTHKINFSGFGLPVKRLSLYYL